MKNNQPHPQPQTSKTQLVYEWLIEEIASGAFRPGERIRQQAVAEALGVSYTPVREAIRRLQETGLITYERNRGNAVTTLDDSTLRELYMLRGAVEGLGARLAANKMTETAIQRLQSTHDAMLEEIDGDADPSVLADLSQEFHSQILEIGGPQIVYPKAQELWKHYPVPRSESLWGSVGEARRAAEAHGQILKALDAGDAVLAGSLMEEHIVKSVEYRV
jgi:DNA-binding GntR family transcriptional regulator